MRAAAGDRVAVTAKLNMADGVPGGLWVDESLQVAALLEADGHLDALELTGGSSLANPMYLFRGDVPRREFAATLPPVARFGFRLVGRRFMPEYPFEEAFFLPYARQFRAALTMPLILLGGINRLDTIERAIDDGFAFVAMARALLRATGPRQPDARRHRHRVALRPLQQVHADDLPRHALCTRRLTPTDARSRRHASASGAASRRWLVFSGLGRQWNTYPPSATRTSPVM